MVLNRNATSSTGREGSNLKVEHRSVAIVLPVALINIP